ncbi:TPA: bifunctional diaminohydroxyphosphoribosylaminopyrimidine deaminase/5-amino-6-(5-phosphoribosylamino)uracil reductase RibD [Candidatus Sumerlaeota bacterium]|jgi:diaminohydroxyphosphoribosylaminopyrimidine deaminase / 5-amino-6-(5-phosphoribosylamino)uracil reductase|nr:bifunctional diaminohydroxyphosphoribosylaminopyrimidine deaminase/5-amino-6-(5-phosphoribosylamino)uracil reductase RibD [Candidatus Sumerlaeota bacterium]
MGISAKDRQYMRQVLELAALARGCTSPNPMVGAILVHGDQIIGQGFHEQSGHPHAEVMALRDAKANEHDVKGATLYCNLEPCNHEGKTPPCTETIIKSGISRVVAAMIDPNPMVCGSGLRRLRSAGIEVDCGVLEGEARRLNEAFITYHQLKRPFIIAKWAMTLDGRTSTDSGDSRWISNDESRRYAHEIRSCVDAVAVGVGTIFFDNPRLTVRLDSYKRRQPKRIIFDGFLRTPIGARCLDATGGHVILLCTDKAPQDRIERMRKAGHTVLVVPGRGRIIDIGAAMHQLAEAGIQSVLVEGGRQLHTALIRERLADKIVVFVGAQLVGGERPTSPLIDLGIQNMKGSIQLKNINFKSFGDNACIEGYVNLPPMPGNSHHF